ARMRRIACPPAQVAITCASAAAAPIRCSCGAAARPSHALQGGRPTTASAPAAVGSKLRYSAPVGTRSTESEQIPAVEVAALAILELANGTIPPDLPLLAGSAEPRAMLLRDGGDEFLPRHDVEGGLAQAIQHDKDENEMLSRLHRLDLLAENPNRLVALARFDLHANAS